MSLLSLFIHLRNNSVHFMHPVHPVLYEAIDRHSMQTYVLLMSKIVSN